MPLVLALSACSPLLGHPSFNLAIDARGNVYFIDVFKNRVLKVTPAGEASPLIDLRVADRERRLHAFVIGRGGELHFAGYHRPKIWRFSLAGKPLESHALAGAGSPSRGILHVGFDAAGALHLVEWNYGAARKDQKFRILTARATSAAFTERLVLRGQDKAFVDFHLGCMIVSRDGTLYFSSAHGIWKLGSERRLTLLAGASDKGFLDGTGGAARFDGPHGMCFDRDGSILVAERGGRIRRVEAGGKVTTLAGAKRKGNRDGPVAEARFATAFGVGLGPKGRIHVVEYEQKREYRIRIISDGRVQTLARIPSDGVFSK